MTPSKSVRYKKRIKVEKTRSISVGWMHYSSVKERYISVGLARNEGSRTIAVSLSSFTFDLIKEMKSLFFPHGNSTYGKKDDMFFNLGNFKGEMICGCFFTLAKYIQENKLPQ